MTLNGVMTIILPYFAKFGSQLRTRSSSQDETANVNFFYDDIMHVLQNTKLTVQRSESLQKFLSW